MNWMKITKVTACLALGLVTCPASAIIIRHDVSDSEYVVEDSEFPALVDLFYPGDCIGTLVAQSYLLTAAHCAEDLDNSDTLEVNGVTQDIAEVMLHPQYNGWTYDVAFIRLEEPATGLNPYGLYRDTDEQGQTITLVGRGLHATGLEGESGASVDGNLRRATNVVTVANNHWLKVEFESPDEDGVTALEGVGAAGDSGGPAFIEVDGEMLIAGLNSWGDPPPGGGNNDIGKYGGIDASTRVSSYLKWIDSVLDNADTNTDTTTDTSTKTSTETATSTDTSTVIDTDCDSGATECECNECGCASSSGHGNGWWALLGMLALCRRRTRGG